MKTLVAYYSRSGNTEYVAKEIAKSVGAEIDRIVDNKDRSGIRGWLGGGKDAFFEKITTITIKKDPSDYDLVVVGTPVWAGRMVPAVRSYLSENKIKKTAFFCTFGGSEAKTFEGMEKISKKPKAVLGLKDKEVKNSKDKIKEFCRMLKKRK